MTSSTERLLNGTINGVEGEHTCGHCGGADVYVTERRDLNTGRVRESEPGAYTCCGCMWDYAIADLRTNGERIVEPIRVDPFEAIAGYRAQIDAYARQVQDFREAMNQHVIINL